jgi:hypothetical protein
MLIFPLGWWCFAKEACDGSLVDGLDFNAFQRVLEILREREGFTREAVVGWMGFTMIYQLTFNDLI